SPPTASTRGSGWLTAWPFSRGVASPSSARPPGSVSRTCAVSTTTLPWARRRDRERLHATGVDRGVEGRAQRAPEQGEPQRPRLLLDPPPLRLPVCPRAGARAGGGSAAGAALARLHPGRSPRLRKDFPRGARERLLGGSGAL